MTVKLCKDCKFYKPDVGMALSSVLDKCVCPLNFMEPAQDLVRGNAPLERQPLLSTCAAARVDFGAPEYSCGQKARWFEEKGTSA